MFLGFLKDLQNRGKSSFLTDSGFFPFLGWKNSLCEKAIPIFKTQARLSFKIVKIATLDFYDFNPAKFIYSESRKACLSP